MKWYRVVKILFDDIEFCEYVPVCQLDCAATLTVCNSFPLNKITSLLIFSESAISKVQIPVTRTSRRNQNNAKARPVEPEVDMQLLETLCKENQCNVDEVCVALVLCSALDKHHIEYRCALLFFVQIAFVG